MPPDEFADLCAELRLDYVAMMFCDDEAAFEKQLADVRRARPILINCHPAATHFDARARRRVLPNGDGHGEGRGRARSSTRRTGRAASTRPWTTQRYPRGDPGAAHHRRLQSLHDGGRGQHEGPRLQGDDGRGDRAHRPHPRARRVRARPAGARSARGRLACAGRATTSAGGTASSKRGSPRAGPS